MSFLKAALIASLATALFALVAFGAVHAAWLVPIWSRLIGGLPFTIVGASTLAWAYAELVQARRLPERPLWAGLVFGLGAWMALLPVTGLGAAFRLTGFHQAHPNVASVLEFVAAGLTGLAIGVVAHTGWRVTAALAASACVLLAVQAGPLPVPNGRRPIGLWIFLAFIYMACGIVQATLTQRLHREKPSAPQRGLN